MLFSIINDLGPWMFNCLLFFAELTQNISEIYQRFTVLRFELKRFLAILKSSFELIQLNVHNSDISMSIDKCAKWVQMLWKKLFLSSILFWIRMWRLIDNFLIKLYSLWIIFLLSFNISQVHIQIGKDLKVWTD